jgi:hypothetical protein
MRETPYGGGLPPIQMTMERTPPIPSPLKTRRENTPFNKNMYNGYDPAMYIGKYTVLDEIQPTGTGVQRERVRHELVRTVLLQRRD